MKAPTRRLLLWTVGSAVCFGTAFSLLLAWLLVFLPRARVREADELLRSYSSDPNDEIAGRLMALVERCVLPQEKAEELLRTLLAPKVERQPIFGTSEAVCMRLVQRSLALRGFVYDSRMEVFVEGERRGRVHRQYHYRVNISEDIVLSSEDPDDGSISPVYEPGRHSGRVELEYTFDRRKTVARKAIEGLRACCTNPEIGGSTPADRRFGGFAHGAKGLCNRLLTGKKSSRFSRYPPEYHVSFILPFEFDVVEPCNAGPSE